MDRYERGQNATICSTTSLGPQYTPFMCLLRPALKIVLFLTATLIALSGAEIVVRSVRDPRPMEVLEQRRVFPTY